jgi:hypothetical protein
MLAPGSQVGKLGSDIVQIPLNQKQAPALAANIMRLVYLVIVVAIDAAVLIPCNGHGKIPPLVL